MIRVCALACADANGCAYAEACAPARPRAEKPPRGNVLDEPNFEVVVARHLDKGGQLVLVHAAHHHAVDLRNKKEKKSCAPAATATTSYRVAHGNPK